MKIAGVVILYYPDKELLQRLQSYSHEVDVLYLIDNSEHNAAHMEQVATLLSEKVHYLHDGENKGIAIRLNEAADLACKQKFEWLLTMDQDSAFLPQGFSQYKSCIDAYTHKNEVAMFGVQFLQSTHEFNCSAKEVKHLITSGSVINLPIYEAIGGSDEALFIDKVDHEYCLRARKQGYKIVEFSHIFLQHHLGKIVTGRSLKSGLKTPRVIHSPTRMYYILRNYLYLKHKYKGVFADSFDEMRRELLNRTKNNLLYGTNRWSLIKYLIKGYQDFHSGKMGKIRK